MHLVGELIEVLRCFGCTDEDPLLRAGMAFLLANQNEEGLWDADKDPYTVSETHTVKFIRHLLISS